MTGHTPVDPEEVRTPRALVVDDDEVVRWICKRSLEREGFVVDEARDGNAGIALIRERAYTLIVSDDRMPGPTGIEVLSQAAAWQPEARRVLMSGTFDEAALRRAADIAHAAFPKPGVLGDYTLRLHEEARALGMSGP